MNRALTILWIYAVVGGFNSLATEFRAGSDIAAVRTDFASLSSGNEQNADFIEGSSKKTNNFPERNSTEDHALLDKRWQDFRSQLSESSTSETSKDRISPRATKSSASRLKRRRNRRKKSRKRLQNATPVTNLTATATVIDHRNGADPNEITTKMELQGRNSSDSNEHRLDELSTSETAKSLKILPYKANTENNDQNSPKRTHSEMQMSRKTKGPQRGKRRGGKARLRDHAEKKNRTKATREEKRKNLKAKREKRKRLRQERMEQRKRKNQGDSNPATSEDSTTLAKKSPENFINKMNVMIPPSIDYIVEKLPSNDFDTINETVPDGSIDVSVDTPGNSMVAAEPEPDNLNEIVTNGAVDRTTNGAVSTEDFTSNRIDEDSFEGGDLSCLKDNFQPAPEVRYADVKYLRNDLRGMENAFLEVEYICHNGYILNWNKSISSDRKNRTGVRCKNGQWFGVLPTCVPVKDLTNFNETCNYPGRCEQICNVKDGLEKCTCHKGFRMKNNRCEDIDECMENTSVCEYGCMNTVGSYRCKCPKGLRAGYASSCIDINECQLRNGHGLCQDTCINTWGSYKCSCDNLPGTQLNSDGHSCIDMDECSVNNGGCSHTCLNTMGRVFCLCPEGWILDGDWKTCIDIDECAEQRSETSDMRCEFGCINTPGSYSCLVDFGADQPIDDQPECPDGYYRNSTTEDCQDTNECFDDNGGCYHFCVNTIGSYYCVCREGFIFAEDKYTCVVANSSTDSSCPPLFPPKHGYLECSRPIASDIVGGDANGFGGRRRITNRPGSQCVLRCPTGFRINGKFSKQCSTNGAWTGDGDGTCIRYPKPKLICPTDIVLETPPNESMAKLRIPRPKTDVNYDRDVTISPEWLRNSEVALEIGIRNITFTARHPVSKLTVSCSFTITVLEGKPPGLTFCPRTQKYSLDEQHDSIKIAWNEPIFTDNVNVTEISRTNSPGNSFGVGSHQIVYVARDQAGYTTRCVFKLLVNVPYRQTLNHPLPIYHMFYK